MKFLYMLFAGESVVSRLVLAVLDVLPFPGVHEVVRKGVRECESMQDVFAYVRRHMEIDRAVFGLLVAAGAWGAFYFGFLSDKELLEVLRNLIPFLFGLFFFAVAVKVRYFEFKPVPGHGPPPEGVRINGEFYAFGEVHEVEQDFYNKHNDIFKEVKTNE